MKRSDKLTVADANHITGGLGCTSKTGLAYGLPNWACNVGSKLREVEGTVCSKCYASRGKYGCGSVQEAQEVRLASLDDPAWVDAMIFLIHKETRKLPPQWRLFRIHDSGDFQDAEHLQKWCEVARALPDVKFWAPTKENGLFRDIEPSSLPENLIVRLSAYRIDGVPSTWWPTVCTSHTNPAFYPAAHICPVVSRGEGPKSCREANCQACWDKTVPWVSYHMH